MSRRLSKNRILPEVAERMDAKTAIKGVAASHGLKGFKLWSHLKRETLKEGAKGGDNDYDSDEVRDNSVFPSADQNVPDDLNMLSIGHGRVFRPA